MAIASSLDPAFNSSTGTAAITSTAFSPTAGSLIVIDAIADSASTGIGASIADSTGALTWTAIGTVQMGSAGGAAMSWWAYDSAGHTNMTATVTWTGTGVTQTKAVKPTTYTGTATTSSVVTKAQAASATNNLTVNVTTTNDQCRIAGCAIDWNALGSPTSTDTVTAFHSGGAISGAAVRKAANSTPASSSVGLNFDAAGAGTPAWAYKVYEIVPGGTPSTNAPAAEATGTGSGQDATAAAGANADAPAGTGDAPTPTTAVTVNAGTPAGTGVANDATVSTSGSASPTPSEAAGTGVANNASIAVTVELGKEVSAFGADVPANADNADGTTYTMGTRFQPAQDTYATAATWYTTTNLPGATYRPVKFQLWRNDTQAIVATTQLADPYTLGAEVIVPFFPPVALSSAIEYTISNVTDRYTSTGGYFTSQVVRGDLTMPASAGRFTDIGAGNTTPAFPATAFSGGGYFVGVVVTPIPGPGGAGTAYDATVSSVPNVNAPAAEATGTGDAFDATVAASGSASAQVASGAGTAYDATVSTSSAANAPAAEATGAGGAAAPVAAVSVFAGAASGIGEALFDPGTSISLDLIADNAVEGVGVAFDATVSTSFSGTAPAVEAAGAGQALSPAVALGVPAAEAAGAGAAQNATVSTIPQASPDAGAATGTGAAFGPFTAVQVLAAVAAGGGQAFTGSTQRPAVVTSSPSRRITTRSARRITTVSRPHPITT